MAKKDKKAKIAADPQPQKKPHYKDPDFDNGHNGPSSLYEGLIRDIKHAIPCFLKTEASQRLARSEFRGPDRKVGPFRF